MTPMVKTALYALRIYLLVLLLLIAVKFYRVFSAPDRAAQNPTPPAARAQP
ncbi:MAG: hypothetical protein NTW87_05360 [Planctomycetota bacterium]|nr:hypothetical protein [Planctomycetota bacterium]